MADKRISQLIERTDIANNDVLPIVASGATTTNKVTISTIQTWMQDNLDVGVTSVGLSMPSAFVVSNSPVTASGNITVTGAGTVAQYIRGDGSLADFPQSAGGGGASVSYYLNGSVSQGTIGGIAYLEMNKTPILGAGTDFTINANGYIASFITDAGDPGLLEIPAGNWNFETYLSASSGGGSPTFYIELYKVNSGGTATLIASNSTTPESISLGTNINPYFSALAVPQTTLALTDRLALRYYVTPAGRTITLHTENSHLCQIITTFTTGLTALNGLTAQVQNFATGTSGTDFNISSSGSTHTFNIPSASGNASRGLITNATQTIAGAKTFLDDAVINGVNVGRGGGNSGNLRVGQDALNNNTTGLLNTAIGTNSLRNNTTGQANTSTGYTALQQNTTANGNTANGYASMQSNTTGSANTAVGSGSMQSNTTGGGNTATGYAALFGNTTGATNTAIGYVSLIANTTGSNNTANGGYSLTNNTTGGLNTANGASALEQNTTGSANTAVGSGSGSSNTTGDNNSFYGVTSGFANTTGTNNSYFGYVSGQENITGAQNSFFGASSGRYIANGSALTVANNSVMLGFGTRAAGNNQTNQIVIGHDAFGNGSNTVTLGNDSITNTYLKGAVSLTGALNGTSASFTGVGTFINTSAGSATTGLVIRNSGSTSVGTESRLFLSTVGGDDRGAYISSIITSASNDNALIFATNSAGSAPTEKLRIASTGAATFSSSVTATQGVFRSTSGNQLRIAFNDSFYWNVSREAADGRLSFSDVTNGERLTLTTSGNVGIGTPAPEGRLHVLNSAGGTTSSNYVQIEGSIANNSNYPGIVLKGGTLATTYPSISLTNGGLALVLSNGIATAYNNPSTISLNNGIISFSTGSNASATERMRIRDDGQVQPGADNSYGLGGSGIRWANVWAANGTIQTSDEREKKDIIDSDLGLDFVNQLRPVSFKWKVGQNVVTSEVIKDEEGNPVLDDQGNEKIERIITPREGKRTHYGLIAQEVEELLDGKDFGGFIHDEETDIKGLRYDQFVPVLIKAIQELKAEIESLKSKING